MALPTFKTEPIAIVGSSCRFPGGANSPSKLWQLLKNPKDVLVKIPPSRFNPDGFYNTNGEHHGSTNVLHSYLLEEDHREFDHNFFNIHPKEAESMDPQQRMLLETVYECVEAAGYSIQGLKGSQTAIFVGQMTQDYSDLMLRDVDSAPQYAATGISRAILSNRVSYFFDWKGPSSTIDTACSSSLVALHHAVQTLRSGESSLAVAAGVNLILGPDPYILESKLHMLSPTGRSRMWDADADGYARGEGFASILLKTLSQAIKDGDHIECLIRETGVNQDGRTSGITMPSSISQTALIKSTYTRAGLDFNKKTDRCQYFEAHGTGTMAGDPIEARAVRDAFFGADEEEDSANAAELDEPLYVGSVKTVIGHLEGTAGLAGLLKASLAVQHGVIPPNMLFNKLNPAISPFYTHLCVPTQAKPWPKLPPGVPRRASVNSFGFGGTNAHAILEHWPSRGYDRALQIPCGPFTLSANTEKAVRARAQTLSAALESGQVTDLSDMAWTLQTRRTQFPHRIYISASNQEELVKKLNDVASQSASTTTRAIHVTEDLPARILGVYTGQGAQWPSMGRRLYEKSKRFKQTIDDLEKALSNLAIPPSWSLSGELVASAEDSRIHEAAISQPLCTAIQIALVDLLYASGITFSAVVGHSSGEISAAYAAGHLKAADAVAIAYYRGVFAHLAGGPDGRKGKMMAVGMSFDQALFFCKEAQFAGRIQVAASNSRSSVTLSGDEDAIEEAKQVLDEQQTFARVLKVEKAYHSHHMQRCAQHYLESLQKLDIQIRADQLKCKWYSSVYGSNGRSIEDTDAYKASYWVDNMVKPVLFSQAIDRAVVEEHCHDIVMEVGPHPALKAPVLETLKNLTGLDLPYSGVLKRGQDDMESFSDALGFIWSNFHTPTPIVDFAGFRRACLGDEAGESITLKGIPPYPWDHDTKLWKESRKSRNYRSRKNPMHELLGYATTHGNNSEVIWRNVMKIKEMEWLRGHIFQGQVLFPAAGYVSMAYEASIRLAAGETQVRLVELEDLVIHRAITLEDESSGTEVTFTIRVKSQTSDQITAEYSCYSCKVDGGSELPDSTNFTGRAIIHLGTPRLDSLPSREAPKLPMKPVSVNRLYSYMEEVGLRYTGEFVVEGVERRLNTSTVKLQRLDNSKTKLHPATLDAAFHGIFTALAFPGDGQLWTPYLPTNIRRVRINPAALDAPVSSSDISDLVADCYLTNANSKTICGDVNVSSSTTGITQIQLQSLTCSSFTKATPQNDRKLFAKTVWMRDISSGIEPDKVQYLSEEEVDYGDICERLAYFYLRKLRKEISPEEIPRMDEHFQIQIDWILNYLLPKIEAGNHPRIKKEWVTDTEEDAHKWMAKYSGKVELQMISALGEVQPSILRGQLPALQVMMQKDMLTRLYAEAVPFRQTYSHLITVTSQLAHRYPRMRVLEIGAGTGGASIHMLKGLAGHCHSYTYTDISAGFFEAAQERFREYSSLMEWAVLDIERDPCEQGFEKHSFDVIMSSNALHATKSLAQTLTHCRALLKPGGFMILNEVTNDGVLPQFISSHLPGWWLGRGDGRLYHPTVDESRWHQELLATGFSSVDAAYRDYHDPKRYLASLIVSQAVDDRISLLRSPLSSKENIPRVKHLFIVGGESDEVQNLVRKVEPLFRHIALTVTLVTTLEEVGEVIPGSAVLILSELDKPTFEQITPQKFRGIQLILQDAKYVLWVTQKCRDDNPMSNMVVGLGRSVLHELPDLRLQFLDINAAQAGAVEPSLFVETMLRTICLDSPEFDGILWHEEWELSINGDGLYIPRIVPVEHMNDRLNSTRRDIVSPVSLGEVCIELGRSNGSRSLQQVRSKMEATTSTDTVQIRVHYSSLLPIQTRDNLLLHLCIGSIGQSSQMALVFSPHARSIVDVPKVEVLLLQQQFATSSDAERLMATIIAESIVQSSRGNIWIHDSDIPLAKVISTVAGMRGLDVFFSTSSEANSQSNFDQAFIHPYATERDARNIIPADIQSFVNLGKFNSVLHRIVLSSQRINQLAIYDEHSIHGRFTKKDMADIAIRHILSLSDDLGHHQSAIPLDQVMDMPSLPETPTAMISWHSSDSMDLKINPVDPNDLFSANKTYLLVGLASELGLSLCDWMVTHGARNIVVTSRNPGRVDAEVLKHLRRKGAKINIFALDISDKEELLKIYKEVCDTMPPIAGVANAAMVLNDKLFNNMTLADFEVALKPKVTGTQNLDDIFYSTPLDFFICFSSLTCVMGNGGQSNYAAANMYMHSLVRQRKKRGVSASIIDIAFLLGVGFVARNLEQYEDHLKKVGYMRMSEPEFHTVFAEAIVAGKSTSDEDPEIIIGIGQAPNAPWYTNPRFATYVPHENTTENSDREQVQSSDSVQGRLAAAGSGKDALTVLQIVCAEKLAMILQVHSDSIDHAAPLLKLGIDSLVAVEIRSWFLKEVNVDMPVLKILSGASLADICQDALVMLPPTLVSSANEDLISSNVAPKAQNHQAPTVAATSKETQLSIPPTTVASNSDREGDSSTELSTVSPKPSSVSEETFEDRSYVRMGEMTPGQSRLYFLHVYLEDKTTYNVTMSGKLSGPLNIDNFSNALDALSEKHEGLRTSFYLDSASGKAMQGVNRRSSIILEHANIPGDSSVKIQESLDDMKRFKFDLNRGKWMKIRILSLSPSDHRIIFTFHHIALDGVGWSIFLKDLNDAYAGKGVRTPRQQAIDLSQKMQREAASGTLAEDLQFWKDTYDSIPEPMPLFPTSKVQHRQLLKSYDTETLDLILQRPLVHQIKQASADLQLTSFHFYLSAIAAFVSKCLNIGDFAVGILDANRTSAADMTTIGYFTNLLPLHFKTNASESFADLAVRTRDITLAALSHSRVDFDQILDTLNIFRSGDQNPLFQIAVNYRLGGSRTMPLGECEIQWTSTHDARNPYDLIIDISEIAEGTIISFTTQSYLYSTCDTDMLLKWYTHTLKEFAADTSKLALDCTLAPSTDIQRAISVGRGSRIDIEWDAPTLAHRIIEMAETSPTSMAIKDGYSRQLTYSNMMRRVQQFAEHLSNLSPGSYVGVLLEPAADTICSLVAIMILGLVYVPLDLRNPEGRLAAIIADCKHAAIICQNETLGLAQKLTLTVGNTLITLLNTSDVPTATTRGNSPTHCLAQPHAPGFAIYTSGSTGTPKGVLLTHHCVLNQIWGISKMFEIKKENVLQQSSFGFDLSLEQVFIALANGGTLIVASKEARGNALEIANLILSENITYTVFVPSEYLHLLHYTSNILKACSSWKFAFSGGEKVTAQLRRGFKKLDLPNLRLINLYGPAEASLSCTRYEIPYRTDKTTTASPAGFVMPNYTVIVVDQIGSPLPFGFPGEICIAGAGNSIGYVNQPQETASKFTPDRVSPVEDINRGWNTLYHTGDKGRMLDNGLLEFIGRLDGDSQVKIRGMRIEMDEIAKTIVDASQGVVDDASVSLRGSDLLVAYVVFSDGFAGDTNLAVERIRNDLPLPSYMCPAHIIAIDEIPRNPNGKKDKSKIDALPIPDALEVKTQTGDLSDFEKAVVAVWRDVLPNTMKLSQFGSETNFFFVGGNSLLLLKLQAELEMAFGRNLTLSELFQASTIREMAAKIQAVSDKPLRQHIDWNKEIRSLCDGLSRSAFTKPVNVSSSKSGLSVVLTGATGFLGRNILKCLVNDDRVSEVHCIAIRPDVNGLPRHVDVSSPKIIEYSGDLADHDLGLSPEQLESIASRANVIVHNGADVSFMKTYQSLRRSNVLSTRRLAEIAAAVSIPFHFVSTASVAHLYPGEHLSEVPLEAQADLPADGQQGYAISKWVSEALLEYLADNHDLQSCVHRPTSIIGDGAPDTDIIASLHTYSEILGSVPKLSGVITGNLDFVDVQNVAKEIATQALASTSANQMDPSPKTFYINHCNEEKVSIPNLKEYMEKAKGKLFSELELNDWLQKAREAGLNELICVYLKNMVDKKEPLYLPSLVKGKV
ncbi:beta-ketoacyl synthase domain-containing protein [Trichoderma gamsii]|uniref:Beta-ketoacyl synthase domain-containing protein n=1 Tax=Trichoderma gamsii TaxID=398673 RepID=A0A2P4ZDG7_9HYPO|nr:beta-ketoacyl synthase domain-containing protein [Trichoderma gamsii]PON22311.1 beta-ketoacyl synthase domain-containing protein [Trichoderma gamsii]